MGKESIQQKRLRIRPSRVNLTYEVETGGAIQIKELPFVVGVLADLAGKNKSAKEPKFVNIDRDNFDQVMERITPRLSFRVNNTLTAASDSKLSQSLAARMGAGDEEGGSTLGVEIDFESIKDFEPDQLVQKIEPLRKLVQARKSLSELLAKMDGNDDLERLLREILEKPEAQKELSAVLEKKEESNA